MTLWCKVTVEKIDFVKVPLLLSDINSVNAFLSIRPEWIRNQTRKP